MYRKVCCTVLLLVITTIAYNQQTYPHTLLWRISGKGLTHPSYLYGTIHLTDKRVFRFGDSVYHAIEKSDGLAIEVNPDELVAYTVNKAFDEIEGRKLSEILTQKDYKKYSAALEKKFKKPAARITTSDVVREKNKWLNGYLEKGEMSTFMDAYLYNIARRQGKWLGGVEDLSDQSGLLDELVDKSDIDYLLAEDADGAQTSANHMMERLVRLYTDQDLSGIDAFMNGEQSPEEKDIWLIKRNVKMARRIDSLTALRTMFVAVGAAHLPGDSGVIHLLQQRGFTVEPVFSSRKINPSDYTFKEVHLPWTATEDPQGFYKVSMPGNPSSIKLFGFIDLKFLFDIFNLSGYCTMAAANSGYSGDKDSVLTNVARRMFKDEASLPKKVVSNGVEGIEFTGQSDGQHLRVRAFMHDKIVYLAYVFGAKKEAITTADADTFFSSFLINKTKAIAEQTYPFTDSVMGISFNSPAKLTYNKKLSNENLEGWHISSFAGADMANGSYVMLFSKDVAPAHFMVSDSLIQNRLKETLKAQYPNIHYDTIIINGCTAMRLRGRNSLQPSVYLDGFSLIKHNRNIVLFIIGDSTYLQSPEAQKIFTSFRFIDPPSMKWNQCTTADSSISAWVPGAFRTYKSDKSNYVYAFDTTTASSYYVFTDTLAKYTWYKDDSSFWQSYLPAYIDQYSVEKEEPVQNAGLTGKELLIRKESNYKKLRLLLHGNIVYEIMVSGDKDLVLNSNATAFFNNFRVNTPVADKNFLTRPKTVLLLQALGDKDPDVRSEAFGGLYDAPFDKNDIPLLHEALLKQYQSTYDSTQSDLINLRIANKLSELKDSSTITFIKEHYADFIKEKEWLKNVALTLLAGISTKESYTTLALLINRYELPAEKLSYNFIAGLRDSLALTATIFNDLQKLAKDSLHVPSIAQVTLMLKDSGYIQPNQMAAIQNDYINGARKWAPVVKKTDEYDYGIYTLTRLIGRFNTTAGNNVLKSYLAAKDKYLKKTAAIELVKNKQPIPSAVFINLAADKSTRRSLYDDLKDLKKTALFPKQYQTQQLFAETDLYGLASDDDVPQNEQFNKYLKSMQKE